jgi:dTDP-4-dehydrorhamnose reductase
MNFVIVGASGRIGSELYARLAANHKVTGTFRSHAAPGLIGYDLLRDDPADLPVDWHSVDSVVLAAAMTRIEDCAKNAAATSELNVAAVSRFCEFAGKRNLHVAFLSTDYVYDGTPSASGRPRLHSENETPAPTTQYGKQKAEAEQSLRERVRDHLIVRLSMNVSTTDRSEHPFAGWAEALTHAKTLRLATDLLHCVTLVGDTCRALQLALQNRMMGVFNLSAPEFRSRYEWGRQVCEAIGADPANVVPCSVGDLGFSEERPRDLSLDTSKLRREVDCEFTAPEELMRSLSKTYRNRPCDIAP